MRSKLTMRKLPRYEAILFLVLAALLTALPIVRAQTNYVICTSNWHVEDTYSESFAPAYIDSANTHEGHNSIRMERGDGSKGREVNAYNLTDDDGWLYIAPGDVVTFSIYMKTGDSSINDLTTTAGIRYGMDFYDSGGTRISSCQTPDGSVYTLQDGYPTNQDENYVNWYNPSWTYRIMNFTINATYQADPQSVYDVGTLHVAAHIVPWTQVYSMTNGNADNGTAWFADTTLYINDEAPTPTPTPTAAPYVPPSMSLGEGSGFDSLIGLCAVLAVFAIIIWPFIPKNRRPF